MSLKKLPQPQAFDRPQGYAWDASSEAMSHWADKPIAAEADDPNTVSIYGVIGEDMFDDGFTARRMGAALRSIGRNAVTVNVNSPGGDMFEGLAIYNLLREHPAKVTVKVMGVAASAASLIAMAGDEVQMGTGSIMMIHNAWGAVIGNRHDFADAASVFETFDASMASIYAARTGMKEEDLMAMLDGPNKTSDGTYMTAAEAIEKGFADTEFEGASGSTASASIAPDILARRRLEAALAKTGMPRSERRALLADAKGGKHDAAPTVTHDADALSAGLSQLFTAIKS
ncbi:MAG: Clp protease ClpP [Loktanella sp.]|nr:Clp protease ClpP [Loktanella sp.]